jgi:hypothetical protein
MMLRALSRTITFVAIAAAGVPVVAAAQTGAADPHHPDTTVAQTAPSGTMGPGMMGQTPREQPGQASMMQLGMIGQGAMGMPAHMMKVFFAIADANGDGALSFDEVTAIHKRILDKVDANKDGKVAPEEIQAFFCEEFRISGIPSPTAVAANSRVRVTMARQCARLATYGTRQLWERLT